MYSLLLAVSGVICLAFASAQTYEQLAAARFLLGFTGAGFVIGIRLVTEWYAARQAGTAQGIYGGWGNFGAAIANFTLPAMAVAFASDDRRVAWSGGRLWCRGHFVFFFVLSLSTKHAKRVYLLLS